MTLKNNRASLLRNIKLWASLHHHMWIQTRVTVRKRLNSVMTSVTLTFDLWPWPFAWTSRLALVLTPENFRMIREEYGQQGVTDGQTDGRTDRILRAAWSQLKKKKKKRKKKKEKIWTASNAERPLDRLYRSVAQILNTVRVWFGSIFSGPGPSDVGYNKTTNIS